VTKEQLVSLTRLFSEYDIISFREQTLGSVNSIFPTVIVKCKDYEIDITWNGTRIYWDADDEQFEGPQ